jgi:Flp pilus assembly protein TadB
MAQTRRKRKRRHRGTQAGTIERAGRTSKPPEQSPKRTKGSTKVEGRALAQQRREQRLSREPTWRGALNRAAFAAIILVIFISVVQKNIAQGVVMGVFALVIYVPLSYYTDLALYRRRQRRNQAAGR